MTRKPPTRRGAAGIDDDDAALWRRVIAGTRPLPARGTTLHPHPAPGPKPPPPIRPAPGAPARPGRPPATPAPLPTLAPGVAPGVDARTLIRLKRGLIPPQAEIDLHRMTQEEAHQRLIGFLAGSQKAQRRCVLVITGKGFGADGQVGVLKAAVPRWLNEPPNRERILAFAHATPPFGGEGALFVLLRRLRHHG